MRNLFWTSRKKREPEMIRMMSKPTRRPLMAAPTATMGKVCQKKRARTAVVIRKRTDETRRVRRKASSERKSIKKGSSPHHVFIMSILYGAGKEKKRGATVVVTPQEFFHRVILTIAR